MQDVAVIEGTDARPPIIYLHGFASSPDSTKARYFAERLRAAHRTLVCPDLNQPDFTTLTMTRMLGQVAGLLDAARAPVTLIGSSLGGTLAILAASKFPAQVARLILMAPAVMFARPGHHLLPADEVADWRREGTRTFFHFGAGEARPLAFAFYEDSLRYDSFNADFAQPTLVFQGKHDQAVDCRTVELFAAGRPNVTLTLVDDDHQLAASLPRMWHDIERFLELEP